MNGLNLGQGNEATSATELVGTDWFGKFGGDCVLEVDAGPNISKPPFVDAIRGRGKGIGAGVKGIGDYMGIGVWGASGSDAEERPKMHGQTLNSSLSDVITGVLGYNSNIAGVVGLGGTTGVGVWGEGESGVLGLGTSNYGVRGEGARIGVFGIGPTGVRGDSQNDTGVLGTGITGVSGSSPDPDPEKKWNRFGVSGHSAFGAGVFGEADEWTGVLGKCDRGIGVYAFSNHIALAAVAGKSGKPGRIGPGGASVAGYFDGGVLVTGGLSVFGAKSAVVPHPDGSHRQLYCMESPECWFEDCGEEKMVRGKVTVSIAKDFAPLISTRHYHVFLTPYGDCNGLFVANRQRGKFVVRELQSGKSTIRFGYRIIAKRKDVPAPRLQKIKIPKIPDVPFPPSKSAQRKRVSRR